MISTPRQPNPLSAVGEGSLAGLRPRRLRSASLRGFGDEVPEGPEKDEVECRARTDSDQTAVKTYKAQQQPATSPMDHIVLLNAVIAKRRKVATIESTLFNPDFVFLLAALLDARDLCQVSPTCKTLGGKRANAVDGLSLVEEAARRLFECASEWERSCLRKYPGEGWIELHHHLLMLRSKLTFDQLVGSNIEHGEERSIIQSIPGQVQFLHLRPCAAIT
ncbi:hypothetical protein THAOC_01253 [Thalassiosira oceanica]|uniref:Uncharacterized protein n=1 Tax=Thalassiosira oceanica TaxID=159749 RepID=K0TIQ6_THAOC|nr:hypothetical protein THAOC_01253 [Thalassiosira oceanica]|eukprot:EJK76954.1 hypothetical protein THAOC_01253 [Thalassiosira oceanica]